MYNFYPRILEPLEPYEEKRLVAKIHGRRNGDSKWFAFDWTININTLITTAVLVASIVTYGDKIVSYMKNQNTKINIMWSHWVQENYSHLNREERDLIDSLTKESK